MKSDIKKIIALFSKFVDENLSIPHTYKITFTYNHDETLKTHAYYRPDDNSIKIYVKNRCIADVLRSIAHELVHHKQNVENKLSKPVKDIGGRIENEANLLAGQLVKKFGYENPSLCIYEKAC